MWIVKIIKPDGSFGYWRNKGKIEPDINNAKTFKLEKDALYRANYIPQHWLEPSLRNRGEVVEVEILIKEKS